MALFPVLKTEDTLQVDDKTRLDGLSTFSPDGVAITLVEIQPEASAAFFDVTTAKFLDYQYATAGAKVATLRVNTSFTVTKTITVVTAAVDLLFSGDQELIPHEPDILEFVRAGRNSFLDVHRLSQDRILESLDADGIYDSDGTRLTKDQLFGIADVNDWSKFLTLQFIFEGLSNAIGDIFDQKSLKYREMANAASNRRGIRLDLDIDAVVDFNRDLKSRILIRR